MPMSLEELKRANAAEPAPEKPEAEEAEEVVEPVDEAEKPEAEAAEAETEEAQDEPWKSTKAERKFTDSDIGAAKHKLRAKLEKQHQAELEAIRAENERLKQQIAPSAPAKLPPRPTEEQFGYDQARYHAALADWEQKAIDARIAASQQALQQQQRVAEAQRALAKAEDEHYSRAEKLITQHSIPAESYRAADDKVRTALERIRPGEGDLIAAQLINVIGDGSEKLFYWLGANPDALALLESNLIRDPSGVQAVAYLSRKAAEFSMPAKRATNAPTPPTQINGDGAMLPASAKALHEAYRKAHKAGDAQAAWNAKRKAKAAGVDTSTWN